MKRVMGGKYARLPRYLLIYLRTKQQTMIKKSKEPKLDQLMMIPCRKNSLKKDFLLLFSTYLLSIT